MSRLPCSPYKISRQDQFDAISRAVLSRVVLSYFLSVSGPQRAGARVTSILSFFCIFRYIFDHVISFDPIIMFPCCFAVLQSFSSGCSLYRVVYAGVLVRNSTSVRANLVRGILGKSL
jgi:hypothetical protein